MLVKNSNPSKLHDELISAGVVPVSVTHDKKENEVIAVNTWITFAEGVDMGLVQQVIDAHDPTPLPKRPTAEERIEAAEQAIVMLMMEG